MKRKLLPEHRQGSWVKEILRVFHMNEKSLEKDRNETAWALRVEKFMAIVVKQDEKLLHKDEEIRKLINTSIMKNVSK